MFYLLRTLASCAHHRCLSKTPKLSSPEPNVLFFTETMSPLSLLFLPPAALSPMCSEYCPLPSHPSPTQLMRGLKCCMKPHTSPTCWTCPAGSESGPGCAWRQNHSAIFPPPCCLQASFQLLFLLQDPCSCWI